MPEVPNFDHVHLEERSFVIGGETFHWHPIWWREFGEMLEEAYTEMETRVREEKEAEARGETSADSPTVVQSYEDMIERVVRYLEPDEIGRFKELVNDPVKRISTLQLIELRDWLQEVNNNRPTEQPSPSDAGRGSGAPTLQAV